MAYIVHSRRLYIPAPVRRRSIEISDSISSTDAYGQRFRLGSTAQEDKKLNTAQYGYNTNTAAVKLDTEIISP